MFAATGVTKGYLLDGVGFFGGGAKTQSLVMAYQTEDRPLRRHGPHVRPRVARRAFGSSSGVATDAAHPGDRRVVRLMASSTDWPLHQFLLDLSGRERPRICFIGTASGDDAELPAPASTRRSPGTRRGEPPRRCSSRTVDDVGAFLLEQDVIYVGGGNTANMLAVWRVHGVEAILRCRPPGSGACCCAALGGLRSAGSRMA